MRNRLLQIMVGCALLACDEPTGPLELRPVAVALTDNTCGSCVFGPLTLTRSTKTPITEIFTITGDPLADYVIELREGGSQDGDGSVELDGTLLMAPRTKKETGVRVITANIRLRSTSTLRVRLSGKPASDLTIRISSGAKLLGPQGGSLAAPGGSVSVTVPAGALATLTEVRVSTLIGYAPPASTRLETQAIAWQLEPAGTEFAKPVVINIDTRQLPAGNDKPRRSVTFAHFSSDGSQRELITPVFKDDGYTAEIRVDHFSVVSPFWSVGDYTDPAGRWRVYGYKWDVPTIKWYIRASDISPTIVTVDEVSNATEQWEAVSQIRFAQVQTEGEANIVFEERGNVNWRNQLPELLCVIIKDVWGQTCGNLYVVPRLLGSSDQFRIYMASTTAGDLSLSRHSLTHEIGHALGLMHTPEEYLASVPDVDAIAPVMISRDCCAPQTLRQPDIEAVQYLYGAPIPPATLSVSPSTLNFTLPNGSSATAPPQVVEVTSTGVTNLGGVTAVVSYPGGGANGWLAVETSSSTTPSTVTISALRGSLAAGTYNANLLIASNAPGVTNSPIPVPVTLIVSPPAIPVPQFVAPIGCGCNPISLLVIGTDLFELVGVGGTSNVVARLIRYSMPSGVGSEPLGPSSPNIGALPSELQTDGQYLYWRAGGFSSFPSTIRRLPIAGGPFETVVDNLAAGRGHFEPYGSDIYFKATHPDGTVWVARTPKTGGLVSDFLQLGPAGTFTLSNDEVIYEDCVAGTMLARSIVTGATRQVASGIVTNNGCSDEMLAVGGTIYVSQILATESTIASAPIVGGPLTIRATNLGAPVNLVSDGTYLFVSDQGSIVRFMLSDFSRTTLAARSCGGLTLDATGVYWTSEIGPPPSPDCLDGGTGPVVRLPKNW